MSDLNPNPDVNLALNKATAQSSVYQPEVYGYDPHGACNGKKTGKFGFHTCQENQPWWQIDLQANYQLAKIKIYNRIGFEKRASALNILLSQDALNWELLYSNDPENLFGGIDGKPLIVDMPYKVARFVQLQLRGIESLHLDEVEIYGFPVKPDSFELKSNQDEATLSANFYGQDNLPGDISIIQGIIARRVDGLGGRLMSILSARYTCEYLGCNLYVSWPRIVSRYYSSNILNTNSLSEIFEGGKIFKDIDVPWIKEEDFSIQHTHLLSSVNKDFKKSGCFLILNKKQTENISRCKFLIWDDPWAMVPYNNTLKGVSLKVKDYWKKINWHHQIIDQIQKFKNQVNSRSYLVVHIRRGDIIQRLLYDNIQTLNRDIPTIFGRFLPIKTAVKFVLDSGFKDVVVCSECEDSTQIIVDQIKQNNHQINCYITSEFTQSLSETQSAAYDLIIMSDAAKILTSFSSTFSTCAEFVGNTCRAKPLTDWENIDWENMADELMAYLDNNNNEMTNERKSLVYLFISKYVQDQELYSYYMSLSKQYQITPKQINMDSNTLNPLNVNLALNKPTAQSSIYQPERYSYDPHGACNGEKTGKFGFHTFEENQPWWQIDLQGTYQLSQIKIYNRMDFKERASSLNILVSQDALNWELCYSNAPENLFGGSDGNPLTVDLQQKVTRFVRLQLREIDTLHLDEVEIYGIPVKLDSSQLKSNQDENALAINFYLHHNVPPSFHAKQNLIMSMLKKLGMYDTELGKVRLGSKGDGGYVIPDDLTDIKGVISIGIGGEVSFDLEWAKMGVKVFQYDHTIEAPPVIHENFVFNKLGWGTQDGDGFITLPKMIETNHLEDGDLFLKFDVENAEWDALFDVSPDLLKRFRIIACELHGFDGLENMSVFQKVNQVINLLTTYHTVVHIHPNNCCGIALVAGIPLPKLIEFTFLRNDRASFYPSHASIPSGLDYPNVKSKPEIVLTPFHLNEPRKLQSKNLALNKPTAQSSALAPEIYDYDPHGACNGTKTGRFGFHTCQENQPWWQIDLEETSQILEIKIYNRLDSSKERASTLNILLSQDALNWELCYSNDKNNIFGGTDGKPLTVNFQEKIARFVRLQLRENQYFHLDEVEIYGIPCTDNLDIKSNNDQATLSANFYRQSYLPTALPPKKIPEELVADFTIGNKIPVINAYYNNTCSSPIYLSMQAYNQAFEQLSKSSFQYYGETLDCLLNALDKYSIFNKTVLIFGLVGINCDAISLWKGASQVYVIDYNLPISEHPQVQVFSYEDYIGRNIQADIGISISSFEHDGLGRYGDPINPNGDLEAMKLSKTLIKKDGLFFFSVPIGKDCLVWNAHRIYGKIRLPMMFEGWELLNSFGFSDSLINDQDLGKYQQPVFVLKNL